jgi:hypothetical protein
MIRNNHFRFLLWIFWVFPIVGFAQDLGDYTKTEIKELSQKVDDQVQFLEYFLNTVGSSETNARDKDVIIRESYKKIFRDEKVQVEDDLLLDRKVITNKDVTAYLKDIEFFFKDAGFKFKVREVKPFLRDNGELSFLVSMDRTLTAVGLNDEKITNTKPRFIEINLDKKSNELKIASIYTTKLSRDEELTEWWGTLSYTWESYFREKIGITEEDSITLDHLYKISSIDSLNLAGNEYLIELGPIEALRELKYIDISNTNVVELNPISNVTFLNYLNIANTPTEDIQFIKYSENLEYLDISGTQIQDISELGNLKKLHTLKAKNTIIQSFAVLNSFESLSSLDVSYSSFNNIENINELQGLKYLNISGNYLMNLDMLSSLESLEEIVLEETNIVDLTPLVNLKKLSLININVTEVSDLTPLNGKSSLRKLYADRTGVTEASADEFARRNRTVLLIHHVENLQTWWDALPLEWKNVLAKINPNLDSNLPTIEDLTYTVGADTLDLSGSQINTLGPVLKFKKISHLKFDDTDVSDLTPLSDIKALLTISGKNTKVKNLQPLVNLIELTSVDFRDCPVEEYYMLKDLPNLTYLNLDNSEIDASEIHEFLEANKKINIIYRSSILEQWWDLLDDTWRGIFIRQFGKSGEDPNLETLHQWTAQSQVAIQDAQISNLGHLLIFNNLRKLSVTEVPIIDFSHVGQMQLLKELTITYAPVTDLTFLVSLNNLVYLDLSKTGIEDLNPLGSLTGLQTLIISGTNIKVLRGLETLTNLKDLDIASTNVKSLKPVQGLNIERLICFNTRLNQRAVDSFKQLNPNADVRFY